MSESLRRHAGRLAASTAVSASTAAAVPGKQTLASLVPLDRGAVADAIARAMLDELRERLARIEAAGAHATAIDCQVLRNLVRRLDQALDAMRPDDDQAALRIERESLVARAQATGLIDEDRATDRSAAGIAREAGSEHTSPGAEHPTFTVKLADDPVAADLISSATPGPLAFDLRSAAFSFDGEVRDIAITNTTAVQQSIQDVEIAGSPTFIVSVMPGRVVEPHSTASIRVIYRRRGDALETATLIARPAASLLVAREPEPARMVLLGHRAAGPDAPRIEGTCGTPISARSPSGGRNSIESALGSVAATWQGLMHEQAAGVGNIQRIARGDAPKESSGWENVLDALVAEGLVLAAGAIGKYLGDRLISSLIRASEPSTLSTKTAASVITVMDMMDRTHALVVNDVTRAVGTQLSREARTAIGVAMATHHGPTLIKEAFFDTQSRTLTSAATAATVSLNNAQADFGVMEAAMPGAGFAALETYRSVLECEAGFARQMQETRSLGMWASFLSRLDLGIHNPSADERAAGLRDGADLERNVFAAKGQSGEWRDDPAKGVLDLRVVWNYDDVRHDPVLLVKHARVQGLGEALKPMLTKGVIGDYPMPILVHGDIATQTPNGYSRSGELRLGRNDGGKVWIAAETGERSERMLQLAGDGDVHRGAAALLAYVDRLSLANVE